MSRPKKWCFFIHKFSYICWKLRQNDTPRYAMAAASCTCQAVCGVVGYSPGHVTESIFGFAGRRGTLGRERAPRWKTTKSVQIRCRVSDDAANKPTVSGRHEARVTVLGNDAASLTAAIYCARNGLGPLVFENMEVGDAETKKTESSLDDSVRQSMRATAMKNGAESVTEYVIDVDLTKYPYEIRTKHGSEVVYTKTLIMSEAFAVLLKVTDMDSENNETEIEKQVTTKYKGVFIACGSGFETGVAAEQWVGPKGDSAYSTIDTAFGNTAKKVRDAVKAFDLEADYGNTIEKLAPVESNLENVLPKLASSSISSADFDPREIRQKGTEAFQCLYRGAGVFGDDNILKGDSVSEGTNDKRDKNKIALVAFFTTDGCVPCARLRPLLNAVVEEYGEHVRLVELDMDSDSELAEALMVAGTPDVRVYEVVKGSTEEGMNEKNETGNEITVQTTATRVATIIGAKTKGIYRDVLDNVLGEDARGNGPRRKFS